MSQSRASISEHISSTGANLKSVASRFRAGNASSYELRECAGMLSALAEALKLYADKMPDSKSEGRHAVREPPE